LYERRLSLQSFDSAATIQFWISIADYWQLLLF